MSLYRVIALSLANENHKEGYLQDHLIEVAKIAATYASSELLVKYTIEQIVASALLHDVIEDTSVSKETIEVLFDFVVADTVFRVTDEEGANRKERKTKTYPKIAASSLATYIKLCDRLHNISRGGKIDMYRKEHSDFRAALYVEGQFENLWGEIEKLLAN